MKKSLKREYLAFLFSMMIGAFFLYVTLNFDAYYFKENTNTLRGILKFFFLDVNLLITFNVFKILKEKFSKKTNIEIKSDFKNKETSHSLSVIKNENLKYFWILFVVYLLIFVLVQFENLTEMNKSIDYYSEKLKVLINGSLATDTYITNAKNENTSNVFLSTVIAVENLIVIYFAFIRSDELLSNGMKKFFNGAKYVCLSIFIAITIYYFVDIPEFKFIYESQGDCVEILGYADSRDYIRKKTMVIPTKIFEKKVNGFSEKNYYYNREISIPSSIDIENVKSLYCYFCKLHIYGETARMVEKDNLILTSDGKEILYSNSENLYIPQNVSIVPGDLITGSSFIKNIEVSPDNENFYMYDNVLYYDISGYLPGKTLTIALIPAWKDEIRLSTKIKDELQISSWWNGITVIIPSDFNRLLSFEGIIGVKEYVVEEGNETYEAYNGSLYSKGLEKLIAVRKYQDDENIELPRELKEISASADAVLNSEFN